MTPTLVQLRESVLNRLFRIDAEAVLNPIHHSGETPPTLELVGMVRQAVNEFKAEAIEPASGLVDYQRLPELDCYRRYTTELIPKLQTLDFDTLTDTPTATAFWINLYNALVLHAVIAYGIKNSIAEGGFGDQVRFFRQAAYNLGGMRFSLEDIEHGVLRANAGNPFQFSRHFSTQDMRMQCVLTPVDPRIHFALNCASHSCPPISVYDPENLDQQLDQASSNYINNETKLIDGQLYISKLFSWYKKDFGGKDGITRLILRYLPDGERKEWLTKHHQDTSYKYLVYDWGLNKI